MNQSSQNNEQSRQAREALADARARSRSAAGRLPESVPWFEAIWLAYIAGLVLSMALPMPFNLLVIFALLFGLSKAVSAYQERYGVWVSGFRPGRTRVIAVALGVVLLAILMIVWFYRQRYGLVWPAFPAAAVAVGASFVIGRMWMRAYRRETGQS